MFYDPYPILYSKVAYVPPSMRNKVKPGATFKLSEDEPAQNAKVMHVEVTGDDTTNIMEMEYSIISNACTSLPIL